jgi:hypothetical protein
MKSHFKGKISKYESLWSRRSEKRNLKFKFLVRNGTRWRREKIQSIIDIVLERNFFSGHIMDVWFITGHSARGCGSSLAWLSQPKWSINLALVKWMIVSTHHVFEKKTQKLKTIFFEINWLNLSRIMWWKKRPNLNIFYHSRLSKKKVRHVESPPQDIL